MRNFLIRISKLAWRLPRFGFEDPGKVGGVFKFYNTKLVRTVLAHLYDSSEPLYIS